MEGVNFVSLWDFLGKPAGKDLGEKVFTEALINHITVKKRHVSNKKYEGLVCLYPIKFLEWYFDEKTSLVTS